jgi:hypothetical protein
MTHDIKLIRSEQVEQSEIWDELKVKHMWVHLVRGLVHDGEIAVMGVVPFCVLVAVKAYTDIETGNAHPGVPLIAKLIGKSHDVVQRALKTLTKLGYLEVEKAHGKANKYSVIEKIPITHADGQPWGTAVRKYVPLEYAGFVAEIQRLAKTGNIPGDKNITINVTLNVQNINQVDNGTVIQNVVVSSDAELHELLKGRLNSF